MQRVIVAGGLGALGSAVVNAFRDAGASVIIVARGIQEERSNRAGEVPIIGGVDLASLQSTRVAIEQAVDALGGLDVLVNVAGGFRAGALSDADPAIWEEMFAVNLKTCVNTCHVAVPLMGPGGRIINVGAASAARGLPTLGAYAASKSGVARLTESLAAELQGRITVNSVLPGTIDTPANRHSMPDADPAGWTTPEAIADVICFLASSKARAINGALIPVTNAA